MLTKRENLLRTLRCEENEWIPITVACDPYNQPSRDGMPDELAAELGEVRWKDNSPITLARWLDLDVFVRSSPPVRSRNPKVTRTRETKGDETHTTITTPSGQLTEIRRKGSDGAADYALKHLVETEDDLKILAEMMEAEEFEFDPDAAKAIDERMRFVGDDGIVAISVPGTPLGMMARVYSGVAALAYLSADCPDTLHHALDAVSDNYLRQLQLLADVNVDSVWSVDDTSTTVISPAMFEEFAVDHINRGSDEMHRQGKLYMHHSCGLILDLLDIYRRTKMDAVHAVCPPPIGNTPLDVALEKLGPDIAVMGVLPQLRMTPFTREGAERSLNEFFDQVEGAGRLELGLCSEQDRTIADMEFIAGICKQRRGR